jgi:hypothetical protein
MKKVDTAIHAAERHAIALGLVHFACVLLANPAHDERNLVLILLAVAADLVQQQLLLLPRLAARRGSS